MKIVVNARFLTQPISGVQRYAIECSRQIKKLYPDVVFVAPGGIIHTAIADELGVKITGRNKGHLWEQADLLFFMAKQGNAPLVNLANTAPVFYKNNFVTIHDLAFHYHPEWNSKMFSAWYKILVPRLARHSRHIFSVSETVKKEITDVYQVSPSHISVTFNGISQAMKLSPPEKVAKEKFILSVGTFNIRKNHQALVHAFLQSKVKETYRLVIVGDKNKVFRESRLDEQQLATSNIEIIPSVSEADLISLYRRAAVVASTSLYEGFGIPLLEGLYYGCRIVCSDIPVYRELYNGYATFCAPFDANSICDALAAATQNDQPQHTDTTQLLMRYDYAASAKTILAAITSVNK